MSATLPFDHGCCGIHWSMMYLPSSALLRLKRSNSPPEQPVPRTDAWTVTYCSLNRSVSWRLSSLGSTGSLAEAEVVEQRAAVGRAAVVARHLEQRRVLLPG